eukprot:m.208365 g.208365  ORF g.208365 m.208365 type:complete len:1107 (+) comp39705_c0_seq1:79-3399(+)
MVRAVIALLFVLSLTGIVSCAKNDCSSKQCKCCTNALTAKKIKSFKNKASGMLTTGRTNLNMQCMRATWTVTLPDKRKKIRLKMNSFKLANGDSLRLYDGLRKTDRIITEFNSIHKPHEIITSGPNLLVTLKTTCEKTARLFTASFITADCGGLIIASQESPEVLSSPKERHSFHYPPNSDCLWIAVPQQTKNARPNCFSVQVKKFATEPSDDVLKIYSSLDQNQAKLHQFSGKLSEQSIHFKQTPGLVFRFTSDRHLHYKGFKLKVQLSRDCSSTCQKPESIQHGDFHISNFTQRMEFKCCPGYEIAGPATKTCNNGKWIPKEKPTCKEVTSCKEPLPPENGRIIRKKSNRLHPVGTTLTLKCNNGFYQNGKTWQDTIKATCSCTGNWKYDLGVPYCKRAFCSESPPNAPPEGNLSLTSPRTKKGYPLNTIVNYTCPDGYGLRGIPYRICDAKGRWSALSQNASPNPKCIANLTVCSDPGIPGNSTRRVLSFEDGAIVAYHCNPGYEGSGSFDRVCHASDLRENEKPYWDGKGVVCTSLLKDPEELAAQLRFTFLDRVIACENQPSPMESPPTVSQTTANPTAETATPTPQSNNVIELGSSLCRGRSIIVGQGCVDTAFIVDCSGSMENLFNKSITFVTKVMNVFSDVDNRSARFAFVTYDDKVTVHFDFEKYSSMNRTEVIDIINKVDFNSEICGGATATSKVLKKVNEKIFSSVENSKCTKAAFLITDGHTNWAGDPKKTAEKLKDSGVDLYAFAIYDKESSDGTDDLGINLDSLRGIASKEDYVMAVGDITTVIGKVFDVKANYTECGRVAPPTCAEQRGRTVGGCRPQPGAWPWVIAIYTRKEGKTAFLCGGSIIDRKAVMTAAHCIRDNGIVNPKELLVVTGDTRRFVNDRTEKTYTVCSINMHNDFPSFPGRDPTVAAFDNDIAILQLCCLVEYGPFARPICLPQTGDEKFSLDGALGTVAGWGGTAALTEGEILRAGLASELHQVELPIADVDDCIDEMDNKNTEAKDVTANMFCAGDGEGKKDSCKGDSGGPFFSKRDGNDKRYVATGIVSWGLGCAQEDTYGVYTKVANYLSWIKEKVDESTVDEYSVCKPDIELV